VAEFDYLSFRLPDEFLDDYRHAVPKWGFHAGSGNYLGEYAWMSKYARRKDDGTRERFWEGLRRVIEGMYSIQKDWCRDNVLPWNEDMALRSAKEAYDRCFNGKWSPPGRGLWMMGTRLVNERRDASPLQNCNFTSTAPHEGDAVFPYTRAMDMSMMGVGVGFDTKGAGQVTLHEPEDRWLRGYAILDSREGWVESVELLLRAYFYGDYLPEFDYSLIRPAGSLIKGFGGTAAGPEPLRKGHEQLIKLLSGRAGELLTSRDVVDIMNIIGKLVVSGNVRRSAQVALGDPDDEDFLRLKDWNLPENVERTGADGWSHLSNNSVITDTRANLSHLTEAIALNGEPGVMWLDTARKYGRLADSADDRDWRVAGGNPCMEQPLENHECCTLSETYPTNAESLRDYERTLKFAYLYAKTVTLLPTHWPETNAIMQRNRRIGLSMTGIAQFAEQHGIPELSRWQDYGYYQVREWDKVYSEWLGVRESIKVTTVKPSGTVSLLFGVTPGVHWPVERGYYVRTVREAKGGLIARAFEAAGYKVEDSISDPDTTVVIYLPVEGPDIRASRDVSLWEKATLAATSQRWWSDNSVSVTLDFRPDEHDQVGPVLSAFAGQLKTASFLPSDDGIYPQAPYQRVSQMEWESMRLRIRPVDWDDLYADQELPDAAGEMYCSTDACEIPLPKAA
jgi:ribonucleoside-triphosphate reductase